MVNCSYEKLFNGEKGLNTISKKKKKTLVANECTEILWFFCRSTSGDFRCVNEQGTGIIYKGGAGQKPAKRTSKLAKGQQVRERESRMNILSVET